MHDEENRACDKNMIIGCDKCTCGDTVLHNYADGEIPNPQEQPKQEEWAEEFQKRFPVSITAKHPFHRTQIELIAEDREKIKDFIRSLESRTRVSAINEVKEMIEGMKMEIDDRCPDCDGCVNRKIYNDTLSDVLAKLNDTK